jgi:hypothetical protein
VLIKYVGGDAGGREVPALDGRIFAPDAEQEVPDDIGASLCQQIGEWAEVSPETPAEKAAREQAEQEKAEQDAAAEAAAIKAADAARKQVAADQAKRNQNGGS